MASQNRKFQRPFVVSVEGNIGSGKSSFLNYFQSYPGVKTFSEPVADWCDVGGHNLLALLYQNPEKWSFAFQSTVQLSRLNIILQPTNANVKMIERSLQNNRFCFLEIGKQMGALSPPEYAVLTKWYEWLEQKADIGLDLIVYLRTKPEVAHERMAKRQRPEEKEIPLSYIHLVHDCYETWLVGDGQAKAQSLAPVLILDANRPLDEIFKVCEENRDKILGIHR